ncbi:MAG: hypothetical protein WC332_00010 [Clostridia bacterium]|jgi:hypothetical protein
MYPITCAGGYPIPIKKGRFKIHGFLVTANTTSSATRCTFIDGDDFKEIVDSQSTLKSRPALADLKGLANAEDVIGVMFPEPIQVRNGIIISNGTNLIPGRTLVYIS